MQRRVPDITKIKKLFGFKTTYTLQEIIQDIVKYLKNK
jgi:nucleoside-diphosphate-sugar epimerase